jgi:phosphatidylglycerophosphate synthase
MYAPGVSEAAPTPAASGGEPPPLPPLASVLKSRDVEDPINLWVHRPLAYAFVALIYRTNITPNQVTLLSMLVGIAAAACWFEGSPRMMFWGGVLLWSSAILDGADGILARAKRSFSDLGRALDGTADAVVAAVSVSAGFFHIWQREPPAWMLALMPVALVTAVVQIYLYDYYKESYMQMTNSAWNGVPERLADTRERLARLKRERAPWTHIVAADTYVTLLTNQIAAITLTNPDANRERFRYHVNEESARNYRRFNLGPLRLWTVLSLAPHSYLISICAMFDRLDVYLWFRGIAANVLFVVAILWQRNATRRTLQDLERLGLGPESV